MAGERIILTIEYKGVSVSAPIEGIGSDGKPLETEDYDILMKRGYAMSTTLAAIHHEMSSRFVDGVSYAKDRQEEEEKKKRKGL